MARRSLGSMSRITRSPALNGGALARYLFSLVRTSSSSASTKSSTLMSFSLSVADPPKVIGPVRHSQLGKRIGEATPRVAILQREANVARRCQRPSPSMSSVHHPSNHTDTESGSLHDEPPVSASSKATVRAARSSALVDPLPTIVDAQAARGHGRIVGPSARWPM